MRECKHCGFVLDDQNESQPVCARCGEVPEGSPADAVHLNYELLLEARIVAAVRHALVARDADGVALIDRVPASRLIH